MKQFLVVAICVLAAAGCDHKATAASPAPNVLVAQRGVGGPYGARDPYACSSKTAPTSGPMTAAYARQYVICGYEKVDGERYLNLIENIRVQVGKGMVPNSITSNDQVPNAKQYLLRGSYDTYFCSPVISTDSPMAGDSPGHNCILEHHTHATGACYRTTFGDWKCSMSDIDARQIPRQPPPRR